MTRGRKVRVGMDREVFEWKSDGRIFRGVGIYHLTFVVAGRRPLLGELVGEYPDVTRPFYKNLTRRVPAVNDLGELAMVRHTPFGRVVSADLNALEERYKGDITICRKMVMDDHVHVVLWVHRDIGKSILQVAHGFRQGITHIAQEMGVWPKSLGGGQVGILDGACNALVTEDLPYHILEKPFVRTLSHAGQLDAMCEYVVLNPYRKYTRRLHPELFTMHKDTEVRGLHFRSMGNHWLLDWPERQVVECSRDISDEDMQGLMGKVMRRAELGAVTYTAAKSRGEQRIARAVREAGWPLVVLMLDGFPPAGSENERYYKPGGVYFDACKNGKLLLMEAYESAYMNEELILRTETTLRRKADEKHYCYKSLPHTSTRWRMIAGNEMLRCLSK